MKNEDLSKKLYSRNYTKHGFDLNLQVSLISAVLVIGFIVYTLAFPNNSSEVFGKINNFLHTKFNWLFVLTINASFLFMCWLAFSKYGKIKLGGFLAKPEYSKFSWYAMLFSAGIGIGIFFYGVAEPIYHLHLPASLSTGSQFDNFKIMYMHWGAHAWAAYGLVAVGLGYFSYNKGLPFSLRSLFYPLLKDKIFGFFGNLIDTIAVLAVLFGLATSLGLGAQQINAGLHYVFGINISSTVQVILIIGITFIATLSVVSGINKGIKFLSQLNAGISALLLLLVLLIGPTVYILSTYLSSMGLYLSDFFYVGLFTGVDAEAIAWQGNWSVFYWAWWITWTPFVGTFIARISKGRTIKEVAMGTVIIPTIIITFAMTILGATGVYLNEANGGVIADAINSNISTAMFEMFNYITTSVFVKNSLSCIAIIAVILFFVTSSDSGSLVVDNLASGGKEDSPKKQRIFWALMEGLIAAVVLLSGGSKALSTLQAGVMITALPFSILLLVMMFSLSKELKKSYKKYEFNKIVKIKKSIDKLEDEDDYR